MIARVSRKRLEKLRLDPISAAKAAQLRYVMDDKPGITRSKTGKAFKYALPDGSVVKDQETLYRIKHLAIPPAWTDVWICPFENGHIQATGRDARGRKQYRYHARWREVRDSVKYSRMILFADALPKIRAKVEEDLKLSGLSRDKVLATIVRLLETTLIRVGNEEYAKQNKSFGLTTMRDQHVEIDGSKLRFEFRGKSGKWHSVELSDRRLAKIVARCQVIPGYELFQYLDEQGQRQSVDSSDVNEYLRRITGEDFTAKDFRTWAGTVLAAMALQEFEQFDSQTQAKKNIVKAIEDVSARLGNTPSICRKCYVHPAVLDAYLDGSMLNTLRQRTEEIIVDKLAGLRPEEAAVTGLLQQRLARELAEKKAS